MKLHESTKNRITKYKKGEKVPYLEIKEVVLIHCTMASYNYQQNSKSLASICF